jgi:methyltransferase (TIGR00027 family)
MQGNPSRTAWSVARRRAAHQMLDRPVVFEDPLAVRIVGGDWQPHESENRVFSVGLRSFVVARSRYAEDELASAWAESVRQYVVLGAGLDTFAYRNPWPGLQVFEVDHPATQEWKRELLARAEIRVPANMTFVPVDFETQSLGERLKQSGLADAPAFFCWLGVTPYLTREAFDRTIAFIASLPQGTGVVFDYGIDPALMNAAQRAAHEALAARVALAGEPFRLSCDPTQLAKDLRAAGFSRIEDLDAKQIDDRYFAHRADGLGTRGGPVRFLCAYM